MTTPSTGRVRIEAAARLVVAVLLVALAGCTGRGESPPRPRPVASPSVPAAEDLVSRSLQDIERYWADTYPALSGGAPFEPLQGGYHPYTEADPPPPCGGEESVYQPNAFYCPTGDFIAWDDQLLIPQLRTQFGSLLVGVVMAHEYGHAIQARLGLTDQPSVVLEQQADCFAGAWLAEALAGRSTAYSGITPAQLDNTIGGLLLLRDQPGMSATAEGAHGNAFDRVRAMQDGIQQGAAVCAGYSADNLPVTEVPFTRLDDARSGGNLPYDEAVDTLSRDAEAYWGRTFPGLAGRPWRPLPVRAFDSAAPACANPDAVAGGAAFYCPDGEFIAFDNAQLGPALYRSAGDNAVGMLIGELFARAAQHRRGASTREAAGQLAVDCLAGSWTNDLLNRDDSGRTTRLSPGDLDEAVAALLAFGRAAEGSGPSAFDRIAAYRKGVLQGLPACE
ncbi:neutral zinc metallopeptidase [Actinoplanes sp. NPDC049118]|uniref:neutral zinc metallopeptidase n=1 Tax=Actinoplanes sp. NPDC049118 TaxID=3155769 RepID=UPI0033C999F3